MGIISAKNVPQHFTWEITKPKLNKSEKTILKNFFEIGPSIRQYHYKKLGVHKKGKSYSNNIDKLVQLHLLKHEEIKEWNKRVYNACLIDNPELRKAVINAYKTDNFSRPEEFTKEEWKEGIGKFRKLYPKHDVNIPGGSFYSLTIWGIITHLRNEGKIPSRQVIFFPTKEIKNESRSSVTDEDLDLVLEHFKHFFEIIPRKWKYLCKNNEVGVVYQKLFDTLLLANYYYEILNAPLERFEQSALDDIYMNFFMPYILPPKYTKKWITSIVRDNEMYDYLTYCLEDLQKNYKTNQVVVAEYKKTLDSFKIDKKRTRLKFDQTEDFARYNPTGRKNIGSRSYYLGNGYWGYFLSNFLNVLDFGPLNYGGQLTKSWPNYRKKRVV